MSTAKAKKSQNPAAGAFEAAADQFVSAAEMLQGGVEAALDAGAEQARAAYAFEGVEYAGRENVDAARRAGEAYLAGLKELNALWFAATKDAARKGADAAKTLSGCKTPEDLSQAQLKLASDGVTAAIATANGFSEAAAKAAAEVAQPLKDQYGAAFAPFWGKTAA